jgi:hypothetical protein
VPSHAVEPLASVDDGGDDGSSVTMYLFDEFACSYASCPTISTPLSYVHRQRAQLQHSFLPFAFPPMFSMMFMAMGKLGRKYLQRYCSVLANTRARTII